MSKRLPDPEHVMTGVIQFGDDTPGLFLEAGKANAWTDWLREVSRTREIKMNIYLHQMVLGMMRTCELVQRLDPDSVLELKPVEECVVP